MDTKIEGYYRGSLLEPRSPNVVPGTVPPFDVLDDVDERYEGWQYLYDQKKDAGQWRRVTSKAKTKTECLRFIREQCRLWGIRYVKRQWSIQRTKIIVTREQA